MATLEELFTFIDCWDEGAQSVAAQGDLTNSIKENDSPLLPYQANKISAEGGTSEDTSDATAGAAGRSKKTRKRRRKRTGWSSSTGLQRRKRAELQFLRQHVRDLEDYLSQLKNAVPLAKVGCDGETTTYQWRELATTQLTERLRSQDTNRTLKAIMNNQLRINEDLRQVLDKCIFTTSANTRTT